MDIAELERRMTLLWWMVNYVTMRIGCSIAMRKRPEGPPLFDPTAARRRRRTDEKRNGKVPLSTLLRHITHMPDGKAGTKH
ncbi:uncharacterized protein SPSK_10081 [Sporothrix schenckii 1099-18]|uniref:Uncharacterized protein n=1 Tax=Sporothrix schenckii 1099-18 TaxID=1397361 RepID=A0A0F2MCT8_SPOSC|nr:uncharacterized protein SPSK_10081 [Sporothrix schenckii 1099-18]KJR85961.1 hypothetical protein SPSK_10081 [Sporothrix schenckii 1099-18]